MRKRDQIAFQLEQTETRLILKALKVATKKIHDDTFETSEPSTRKSSLQQYLGNSDRESLRLSMLDFAWFPPFPLMGKKVDKIEYYRKELVKFNEDVAKAQSPASWQTMTKLNSVLL